jgi:hypothetical protein
MTCREALDRNAMQAEFQGQVQVQGGEEYPPNPRPRPRNLGNLFEMRLEQNMATTLRHQEVISHNTELRNQNVCTTIS